MIVNVVRTSTLKKKKEKVLLTVCILWSADESIITLAIVSWLLYIFNLRYNKCKNAQGNMINFYRGPKINTVSRFILKACSLNLILILICLVFISLTILLCAFDAKGHETGKIIPPLYLCLYCERFIFSYLLSTNGDDKDILILIKNANSCILNLIMVLMNINKIKSN